MAKSSVNVEVKANVAQAVGSLASVSKAIDTIKTSMTSFASKTATYTAAVGGVINLVQQAGNYISGAVSKLNELVDAYTVQEKAEIKLQSALESTQNAIGMSASELGALASSFQSVTTFGDEAILEVERLFVSSQKISKEAMPQATEAVLDMAAAMGEDLTSAAKRMAKVLADPKGNLDALKDANIQLSQKQKDTIKNLQEQNDLYGAQKIVLDQVSSAVGGTARALADTDTGKLTQISNVYGDIKEGLGGALLDTISPSLDTLYDKLQTINDKVQDMLGDKKAYNQAKEALSGNFSGRRIGDFSDEELQAILANSAYYKRKTEAEMSGVDTSGDWAQRGINVGAFTKSEADVTEGALKELLRRRAKAEEAARIDAANVALVGVGMNDGSYLHGEKQLIREAGVKNATSSIIIPGINKELDAVKASFESFSSGITGETEAVIKQLNTSIDEVTNRESNNIVDSYKNSLELKKLEEERTEELEKQEEQIAKNNEALKSSVDKFIASNTSLSPTSQIAAIQEEINQANNLRWAGTEEQRAMIEEIISGLELEKQALLSIGDASEDVNEITAETQTALEKVLGYYETYGSAVEEVLTQVNSLWNTILDNQISAAESALDKLLDKWDDYFSELEEKQDNQRDTLNALLASGRISYEDYVDALSAMDEEKAQAETEAAREKEEAERKADALKERQFNLEKANSIAQIGINTAVAITKAWTDNPWPVATALTALIGTASAIQLGAVAAQQYTPLAAGGIVQSPTRALIGEGGAKEAIIPLTDDNFEKMGFGKKEGNISIIINVENVYSNDDLAEGVFRAIERAQRTGSLPNWSYA